MAGEVANAVPAGDQADASDPQTFVWVSANAGSGKTHVLVERLMRILLAGTPPSRILCLTFTNAAAAEMANRLFKRLSEWAVIHDDDELTKRIAELTRNEVDREMLARARRLFPIALEAPGGLKIYTIHAFCERLLHRFPLEAGVSPHFQVIDERGQRDLIDEARERVMNEAARERAMSQAADARPSPLVEALAAMSALAHDLSLNELLARLVSRRTDIAKLDLDDETASAAFYARLAARLGVDPNATEEAVLAAHFADAAFDTAACVRAAEILATGSTNDRKMSQRLVRLSLARTPLERYHAHCSAILTTGGTVRKSLITKALAEANRDVAQWLAGELARAEALRNCMPAISTLSATRALLTLASAVIAAYERAKAEHGFLDYDDLIARALGLLVSSADAAWVLYKLDGGIDHILVDEAQDTSPSQWAIVQNLAEDMLSGESARSTAARATFAVGDEKQSIFSFQGADPQMFALMRDAFERRTAQARLHWKRVPLETSYRSAPQILAAVDCIFADPDLARSLSADGEPPHHEARRNVPGRVEIWPVVEPDDSADRDPWTAPVDYVGPADPRMRLAARIADEIAGWLANQAQLDAEGRPIRPGDILILVRRRNAFVDAMVRELKRRDVPVAGVDRMRLTEQIVVEDLIALARFVLLPEDDLSLAALIKSPLIGLDEECLFAIAHDRSGSLWQSLIAHCAHAPQIEAARARLARWIAMADQTPPFAFYARVLAEDGMRRRIAARLGAEADDPIAEFLNATLDYERQHAPSLEGFVDWLLRSEGEIKRDLEHGRDEVRVMTVHGAKGLEANIVILPDTCQVPAGGRGPQLLDVVLADREAGADAGSDLVVPVWAHRGAAELVDAVGEAKAVRDRASADEYLRLLYVAMTRARDWLIVAGYRARHKPPERCWYEIVRRGLEGRLDEIPAADGSPRWLFRHEAKPDMSPDGDLHAGESSPQRIDLPDWARQVPESVTVGDLRIVPSRAAPDASDEAALSPLEGGARAGRYSRGLAVHALLKHLMDRPQSGWQTEAHRFLEDSAQGIAPDQHGRLVHEVLAILRLPEFEPFLSSAARSEAGLAATIARPGAPAVLVEGRVDRLAVFDDVVHVVDFKTHRPAPSSLERVPRSILTQMALYRAGLAAIFPGRRIEASLLWTDRALFMPLPGDVLDDALHTALMRAGAAPA